MSSLDAAILASLRELTILDEYASVRRFRGSMLCPEQLVGPPGRVHGGIHPLVRTLPILARLQGDPSAPSRVRIDASLQKGLPLGEIVPFDGEYRNDGEGFVLETRFMDSDRLRATASVPAPGALLGEGALERWRLLFEKAQAEPSKAIQVIGVRYHVSASIVWLDLRSTEDVADEAHLKKALLPGGGLGLAALSTQLDAVGATGRGVLMSHPHFTKHLSLGFDLEGLEPGTPLLVIADRTTIVEDESSEKVEVRGVRYGAARIEAVAVDASFRRCFGHAFVTAHPVDSARFAGFEGMRKLKQT